MIPYHFWTIGDFRTASSRLRIHQYRSRLEADGIAPAIRRVPNGFFPKLRLRRSLPGDSRLLIQKKLFSPGELEGLRERATRLVYDVDDAVYLGRDRDRERFAAVTRLADHILAGNEDLAATADRPGRTTVLPTPVDTERIQPATGRDPGLVVWTGGRTSLPGLDLVLPVWERLRKSRSGIQLLVVSEYPPTPLPEGIRFERWTLETERDALSRASIGIMPLADTPFNRGKCGFKILLYQAAGLPVIASPVGVNRSLITPAQDGFLPETETAWEEALATLLADPARGILMGAAGRDRVVASHSIDALYPGFRNALLETP